MWSCVVLSYCLIHESMNVFFFFFVLCPIFFFFSFIQFFFYNFEIGLFLHAGLPYKWLRVLVYAFMSRMMLLYAVNKCLGLSVLSFVSSIDKMNFTFFSVSHLQQPLFKLKLIVQEYDVEDSVLPLQPSLNYTAPELARSKASSAGCSSDIFSFGCLAYHLIAHKPLFDCHNNVKMVSLIQILHLFFVQMFVL